MRRQGAGIRARSGGSRLACARMKIRAAVLEEFGKPLVVQEVELAEPKAGRGAGAARGVRRLPHRSLHRLRRRPVRLRADACSGTRAPAWSRRSATGVTLAGARRPRRDAVLAAVPRVRPLPERQDQHLHRDPRAAEPGLPARRHDAPVARRRADPPLHGHLDVRGVHGDAGDRAREGEPGGVARRAPRCSRAGSRPGSAPRCTAPRSSPARPASCSAPAWSGSAPSPAAGCRAPSGSSASTCPRTGSSWRASTARPRRRSAHPTRSREIVEMTGGFGADYTFEATGLVSVMAAGRRGGAHGLGRLHDRRRGGQGRDARRDPALADPGPQDRSARRSAA